MASYTSQLTLFFERCIPVHHVDLEKMVIVDNRLKGKNAVIALLHDSPHLATADIPFKAMELVLHKSFEMNILGKLQVAGVRDKGDIMKKEDSLKETFEMAVKLCGATSL